jgi:hypothetical protein
MKHNFRLILIVWVIAISITACNLERASSPTPTQADLRMPAGSTPTPTTVLILGEPDVPPVETTPPPPTRGELELRFTDPGTLKECVAHFPFVIVEENGQRKIDGSGVLDCKLEIEQCGEGVCILYHSTYFMDAVIPGVIHASTSDFPDGFLEVGMGGTFTMKQYWTNVPPESYVAFTEENPFELSTSDIIPLNFNFKEGATEEINNQAGQFPWIFTLHLY